MVNNVYKLVWVLFCPAFISIIYYNHITYQRLQTESSELVVRRTISRKVTADKRLLKPIYDNLLWTIYNI